MAEIDSVGVRIHYEVHGSGTPVVLLHGMGGSFRTGWLERGLVAKLNGAGYQVIGVDARGAGESARVTDPALLSGRAYLRDVTRVLDAAGVQCAHVVGYSMGAGHTLGLAVNEPHRLRSIVLGGLGGIALAMAGFYHESAIQSRERLVRSAALIGGRAATRNDYQLQYTAAYFEAIARDPLERGAVESVASPALLIVGEGDTAQGDFAALTVTAMLEQRIPGARRIVLRGVDHMTCVPDPRFIRAVLDFLNQQER